MAAPARGTVAVGLAAAVLAVAAILVAVARGPNENSGRAQATGASTTTSSSVPTTEPPATSTSVAGPTTTNRTTSTTAVRRTTIAPTTTKGPGPTASSSTTTTAPRRALCTDAQVEVTAASDKARYGPGETVTATVSLRNRSASTCSYAGYSLTAQILDPSGKSMAGFGVVADPLPGTDAPLAPGQVIRHSGTWDQRLCGEPTCGRAPADTAYTISARWSFAGFTYSVTTTFVLV